jgi:DNA-binding transcriptional LysR family regulator
VRDLDVKTLRLFVAVCECRTMAGAAEQERIEPSAISKRIAQLESELGVELLVRGRRGVAPTPAGRALLDHARTVLSSIERIVDDAAAFGATGGVEGRVRLAATASAIAGSLPDDFAAFLREPANRRIRVDVEERFARDLVRALKDGSASLGVCADDVDLEGVGQRPYRRDRLAVAVHVEHPLAACATLRFDETLDVEHVGVPPQTALHATLQRAAAQASRAIAYRAIVASFDAALRLVAANVGVGVVPLGVGRRGAGGVDVRLVPLSDAWAERRLAICFREWASLPPASQRLVEHLERCAAAPA